ncbi:MAG: hypothetical protein R3B09_16980 [Nannocystaceae bacterium]
MQVAQSAGWQGPSLTTIFSLVGAIVIGMGLFAFWRYTESERWVQASLIEMEQLGRESDAEGCVDAVHAWREKCAANKTLCENAIPLAMYHCLEQRDRAATCDALPRDMSTGGWLMERCRERGTPCKVMKQCTCAASYRALDSFCRSDQRRVQVEL